jgi:hypothetical protein
MDKSLEKIIHWLAPILRGLIDSRFYGKVTLEFKDGKIVLIRREETIMPPK